MAADLKAAIVLLLALTAIAWLGLNGLDRQIAAEIEQAEQQRVSRLNAFNNGPGW